MRVLVTGSAGFIGMHVTKRLLERGDQVIGIDNLNDYYDVGLKKARLEQLAPQQRFGFSKVDIVDSGAMEKLFRDGGFEMVVHLAAQAGVRYSLKNPGAYVRSNVVGFLNVLEGCRLAKVRHLLYASSSSVYGGNEKMPYSERHNVDHPISMYAATKKDGRADGAQLQSSVMALFLFTRAILEGRPIQVFNHGRMRRDFTYIDDIVEGVVRALDRPATPDPAYDPMNPDPSRSRAPYRIFNIGNHALVYLLKFIGVLEEKLGRKAEKQFLPMQDGDVPATYADTDALAEWVGFAPNMPIETGIGRFVDWYREYYRAGAAA